MDRAVTAGPDAATALDPTPPTGHPPVLLACRVPHNLAGDFAIAALGRGGGADGAAYVLATGGPAGGLSPVRLLPSDMGNDGDPLLVPRELEGSCDSLAVATDAPYAAAVCNHDPLGQNADGGDEIVLLDTATGAVLPVTSRNGPWAPLLGVTIDANAQHVAYLAGATLYRVDLGSGESQVVASLPVGTTRERMALSADGSKIMVTSSTAFTVRRIDVATGAQLAFFSGGGIGYLPDGDMDASGERLVLVARNDPLGEGFANLAQIYMWDPARGGLSRLTAMTGPGQVGTPRITAAGDRVVFLALAPPDGTAGWWPQAHVAVIDFDAAGNASPPLVWAVGVPSSELEISPDGAYAYLRTWPAIFAGAGVTRLDLSTGAAVPLGLPRSGAEVIDLSGDGRFVSIRRTGDATGAALVSVDQALGAGGAPIETPWAGALDREGTRLVAFLDQGNGTRQLTVYDVASGAAREIQGALAYPGDPYAGPAGVALAGTGQRALYVAHVPEGGRALFQVDLAEDSLSGPGGTNSGGGGGGGGGGGNGGSVTRIDDGVDQVPLRVAIDHAGRRALYWVSETIELRLRDLDTGTYQVVYQGTRLDETERPIALSADGKIAAFCAALGYDATCRLMTVPLGADGAPQTAPRSFPGLDVTTSLALSDDGTTATYFGNGPGVRGLLRVQLSDGRVTRLAPPVMLKGIVRGDTCAWNALDGGAIVATPELGP